MFDKYLTKTGRLSCKQPQDIKNQWYIQKFQEVHCDTYDYSQVDYKTTKEKVEIICKEHGSFFQTPNDHLDGKGCPKCANHNQDTLYILRCLDTGLIKIGITNNLKQRISSIGGTLQPIYHTNCSNPRQLEKSLHQEYKDFQVFNPTVKSGGTEFFQLSESQVLNIIQFLSSI